MKLNSGNFLNALSATSVTKEDVILGVENNVAILSSTDSKAGIQVQAKLSVEGNEGGNEYFLPCGIKDGVSALSSFSNTLSITENAGNLKIQAGKTAKINIGLLNKAPSTIATKDAFAGYKLSGKEFMYAMNLAALYATIITIVVDSDGIEVYGLSSFRFVRTRITYVESQRVNMENMTCESIVDTIKDDTTHENNSDHPFTLTFSISSDIWKRISGVFNEQFFTMYVAQGQLRFIWEDIAFNIPLSVDNKPKHLDKFNSLLCSDGISEVSIKDIKNVGNALSVALLDVGDKDDNAIVFRVKNKKLEFSSTIGSAAVEFENEVDECEAMYNGKFLKEAFSSLKNCLGFQIAMKEKNLLVINAEEEYVYQDSVSDEDIIQRVSINCLFAPIVR